MNRSSLRLLPQGKRPAPLLFFVLTLLLLPKVPSVAQARLLLPPHSRPHSVAAALPLTVRGEYHNHGNSSHHHGLVHAHGAPLAAACGRLTRLLRAPASSRARFASLASAVRWAGIICMVSGVVVLLVVHILRFETNFMRFLKLLVLLFILVSSPQRGRRVLANYYYYI